MSSRALRAPSVLSASHRDVLRSHLKSAFNAYLRYRPHVERALTAGFVLYCVGTTYLSLTGRGGRRESGRESGRRGRAKGESGSEGRVVGSSSQVWDGAVGMMRSTCCRSRLAKDKGELKVYEGRICEGRDVRGGESTHATAVHLAGNDMAWRLGLNPEQTPRKPKPPSTIPSSTSDSRSSCGS